MVSGERVSGWGIDDVDIRTPEHARLKGRDRIRRVTLVLISELDRRKDSIPKLASFISTICGAEIKEVQATVAYLDGTSKEIGCDWYYYINPESDSACQDALAENIPTRVGDVPREVLINCLDARVAAYDAEAFDCRLQELIVANHNPAGVA